MNKKQKNDYFDEFPLDDYEKELEEFLEKGKFVPVKNFEKRKKDLQEAAKNFLELQKTKRITLRVKNEDIIKVKAKAKKVINFNSFINIRPKDGNTSNEIQADRIRERFEELTKYFFKEII